MIKVTGALFARVRAGLICALLGISVAQAVGAEAYPAKPVRFIVPFPPGGTVDIVGRIVAAEIGRRIGATVVIENRGGAGGTIGAAEVARAPADGYTFLVASTHHSINPSLQKISYDSLKDLTPVGRVITTPSVLVVSAKTPFRSLEDLIREGRKPGSGLNYGSTGTGGISHLTAELFKATTGVSMSHVPYKGAALAMNDLLGGHIPIMFDSPPTVVGHVKEGKIRALAVSSRTRSPLLPDVPTFHEAGLRDFEAIGWVGIMGPGALPEDIRAKVSTAMVDFLKTEQARDAFIAMGIEAAPMPFSEFNNFFRGEIKKWGEVIQRANIRIEN